MSRYIILRKDPPVSGARALGQAAGGGLGSAQVSVESLSPADQVDLRRDPEIVCLAPAMPTRLIQPMSTTPSTAAQPWGVGAIGADVSRYTGSDVTVAVLDTGIARSHPAFAGVDLIEKDFTCDGADDLNGHGTHCAGVIFGRDVEGVRIGVARGVQRALIGKVLGDNGGGDSTMIFDAMLWAMRKGAHVVSMSLGFDFPGMVQQLVDDGWPADLATSTVLEAYTANLRMFESVMGVLKANAAFGTTPVVIAASGNESRRDLRVDYRIAAGLPASADGVISVGAVEATPDGYQAAYFSNSKPILVAPGVDIVSAEPGGGLVAMSGTSMAAPHVAGAAALWVQSMLDRPGRLTAAAVSAKVLGSTKSDVFAPGQDDADVGLGLVTTPA